MHLPNAHLAIVEPEKLTGYLLNSAHLMGASKARFFSDFGFRTEEWWVLAEALRGHGQQHEVAKVKATDFGPRYEIEGELPAPRIRTVWQVDNGEIAPRLITAYPLGVL